MRVDPRLVVGLVLVAASVGGVYAVVASLDDTVEAYAARGTLSVGDRIGRADLVATSVRLGAAQDAYLTAADLGEGTLVMTRTVQDGELVPAAAVAAAADAEVGTVAVQVEGRLPGDVAEGVTVELWAARALDAGHYGEPAVIASGAEVARIRQPEGLTSAGAGVWIDLVVPRAKVAAVLQAVAAGDSLSIVAAR